jgi:hypothetical protein
MVTESSKALAFGDLDVDAQDKRAKSTKITGHLGAEGNRVLMLCEKSC